MASKINVAHIHVKKFAYNFTVYSGNIYQKSTSHVVASVLKDGASMLAGADKDSLTNNQYFFDDATLILYVYDASISDSEYLVTYKLLFSTAPISLSHDLSDDGVFYEYLPRLAVTSAFNTKIDASAIGTALIGAGSLRLENTDGFFNSWNGYIWEAQEVKIYSIEDDVSMLVYDGIITGKDYDRDSLNIKVSNQITIVNKSIESDTISDSTYLVESLNEQVYGIYRNRIWGRVDGVKAQSISVNPESFVLTGTVSLTSGSATVTGSGTSFLNQISSGDTLKFSDLDYDVIEVMSDTSLLISEDAAGNYSGTASVEYNVINPTFNRIWLISAKALRQAQISIVNQSASTIYELDGSVQDLEIGDMILVYTNSTYYLRQIESIFAKNIVINQSVPTSLVGTSYVLRSPIQRCYHNKKEVNVHPDIVEVHNTGDGCFVELARKFEYYTGNQRYIDASGTWTGTSGTNYLTRDALSESLVDTLAPRNYIVTGGNAYEIASITTTDTYTRIRLTTNLSGNVTQEGLWVVFVNPLTYESILSVDCLGETIEGPETGTWIKTGIQFLKQQLTEAGLSDKLASSLDDTSVKNNQLISLIAPISPGQKTMPKLKTLVDQLNKSLGGALFVNNNFNFDYKILDYALNYNALPTFIEEYDIISWTSKTERNDLYLNANFTYRPKQIDYLTEAHSTQVYQGTGKLASLIGHTNTIDFDTCFYNLLDARCSANRQLFLSGLLNTVISIKTDLRFKELNVLDMVELKLNNFAQIIPDYSNRYMVVLEIKKNTDSMTMVLGDIGASLNRRAIVVPDNFSDYTGASNSEIMQACYITDERGIINNEEDTKNFNLII